MKLDLLWFQRTWRESESKEMFSFMGKQELEMELNYCQPLDQEPQFSAIPLEL